MAKNLQFRRGNTAQTLANTMASGELFINTDQNTISVGDGLTPGGFHLSTQNQLNSNVATLNASIASNVSGLATCSLLSNTCSVLNSNITALGTSLNQCFNTKLNSVGGTLCNAVLTGTLNAGGSNGSAGQVLCSSGSGVAWATAAGGGTYFQASGCNLFFCPITTSNKTSAASCNIGIGPFAFSKLTSGCSNIGIGACSNYCLTTGCYNVSVGHQSGKCGNGVFNVAVGTCAMYGIITGTGSRNVAIGGRAGASMFNSSCNVFIGYNAQAAQSNGSASVIIGAQAACGQASYNNVTIGYAAAKCALAGRCNVAVGNLALRGVTSACSCFNVAVGHKALYSMCKSSCNVAIGYSALQAVCSGAGVNVAIGHLSSRYLFGGIGNVSVGYKALKCANGYCTVSIGFNSNCNGTSVARSVSIGAYSGAYGKHYCSVHIGNCAAASAGITRNSVAIGTSTLASALHCNCNDIGIGYKAFLGPGGGSGTTCNNVAIGTCALQNNCNGFCNIAIGFCAGYLICSGSNNVILGPYTGSAGLNCTVVINAGTCQRLKIDGTGLCINGTLLSADVACVIPGSGITVACSVSGACCVTISASGGGGATYCKATSCNLFLAPASCSAGLGTFAGKGNFAAGSCSLANVCSSYNVGIGQNTLRCSTVNNGNSIALGRNSLAYSCCAAQSVGIGGYTGSAFACVFGVFIGHFAQACASTGKGNIAIGAYAMKCGGAGNCVSNNIAIGYKSGCTVGSTSPATGPNVLIGAYTGSSCSGQQNTMIGSCAGMNVSGTNNTLIGYNASPLSSSCCNTITLGNANITTIRSQQTSITSLSDYRDKAYIETLPVGLEFLRQVRPVTFTWKPRDPSSTMTGRKEAGFIAQELETVTNNSSIKDWLDGIVISNEDRSRLEATPGKMFPLIVKAIQELAAENDSLKTRVTALEAAINK